MRSTRRWSANSAFEGFSQALAFVNRVAELAEAADHDPDIEIHYNRVTLRWWTHTAGGISDRDRELASRSSEVVYGASDP